MKISISKCGKQEKFQLENSKAINSNVFFEMLFFLHSKRFCQKEFVICVKICLKFISKSLPKDVEWNWTILRQTPFVSSSDNSTKLFFLWKRKKKKVFATQFARCKVHFLNPTNS